MPPTPRGRRRPARLADLSRDSHLALRRVERQHRLLELLGAAPYPRSSADLARELGVGQRTVERDLARLRDAGVPIRACPALAGGLLFRAVRRRSRSRSRSRRPRR